MACRAAMQMRGHDPDPEGALAKSVQRFSEKIMPKQ
jgi:hypothetical protein